MSSKAIATQLVAVLTGLSITAQIGAPKSVAPTVSAWVSFGSTRGLRKATGTAQRTKRFFVLFVYRLDGDETTAEQALMDAVDSFVTALYADLTLNDTCRALEVDTGLADEPDYQLRAGKEYREYPVLVECRAASESFEVNP